MVKMIVWSGHFPGNSLILLPLPFMVKVNHKGVENNTRSYEKWRLGQMECTETGWDFDFLPVMKTALLLTAAVEITYQRSPVIALSSGSYGRPPLPGMVAEASTHYHPPQSPGDLANEQRWCFCATKIRRCQYLISWWLLKCFLLLLFFCDFFLPDLKLWFSEYVPQGARCRSIIINNK